jgi:hypothetical protein
MPVTAALDSAAAALPASLSNIGLLPVVMLLLGMQCTPALHVAVAAPLAVRAVMQHGWPAAPQPCRTCAWQVAGGKWHTSSTLGWRLL